MKETRIIMSGDHPVKILDGTKTMTRRVMKPQPHIEKGVMRWQKPHKGGMHNIDLNMDDHSDLAKMFCPYGQVGDILIIKETWATENRYNHLKPSEVPQTARIWYLCDEQYDPYVMGIVRPSMFMCLWMSRARPEITEVRVERVTEISEADVLKEGLCHGHSEPRIPCFRWLWDSLNAKRGYGWEVNPWVWVISFKQVFYEE